MSVHTSSAATGGDSYNAKLYRARNKVSLGEFDAKRTTPLRRVEERCRGNATATSDDELRAGKADSLGLTRQRSAELDLVGEP